MLIGAAGMAAMLIFGKIVDTQNDQLLGALPAGFFITFFSAFFLGMVSLLFLRKISDPPQAEPIPDKKSFFRILSLPLRENNFRKFLIYAFCWGMSVHFAAPFFTLYFLRELKFSYGFVALLGTISALADLLGMRFWGWISDRVKNTAVIQFASRVAIFIPLAWIIVRPGNFIIPIILQILAGGFWAGITLCQNNLLLRISQHENKAVFFSAFSIAGGIGSAVGPIISGLILSLIGSFDLHLFGWGMYPLQIIFISSTLFRLLSFQIFKTIREPEEKTTRDLIRVIRSMRGLNVTNGFNGVLHPFTLEKRKK
jgi:MFS family permease